MNVDMPRAITSGEIAIYHRDGVVMLPGMFDQEWVDLLKQGLDANCDDPTDRSRVWDRDAAGRTMFYDSRSECLAFQLGLRVSLVLLFLA